MTEVLAPRFQFPGFTLTSTRDSETHEVEVGVIGVGGKNFVLDLVRFKKYAFLPFIVAGVSDEKGDYLWRVQFLAIPAVPRLAMARQTPIIALVQRGKGGMVEGIMTFDQIAGGDRPGIRDIIALKRDAAEYLGLNPLFTKNENLAMAHFSKLQREEEQKRVDAEQAERARRRAAKIAEIEARPAVTAYTLSGQRRHGIPVVGDEWQCLPRNTFVMLVESIGEDGKVGKPIESFTIRRREDGNAEKDKAAAVTLTPPVQATPSSAHVPPTAPKPVRQIVASKDGQLFEVLLFNSMDDLRAARSFGLNSGAYAAVDQRTSSNAYEVYRVRKDSMDVVGHCHELLGG